MKTKKDNTQYLCLLLLMIFFHISCSPKIYSFKPEQSTITQGDTIKLNWKTRGNPTLLVHEKTSINDPANIKADERLLEFILGFKNSDVYANTRILIRPQRPSDTLYFSPSEIKGDTLIATENTVNEELYSIRSVRSALNRELTVWHAGKIITLPDNDTEVFLLNDTPIGGSWRVTLKMTPSELKDHKTAPSIFKIVIHKQHK